MDLTSPAAARILYAGVSGVGIFKSANGGQNWTSILNGATPVVATELNSAGITGGPARSAGKFIVALAASLSPAVAGIQVLYATVEGRPLNRPRQPTDAPDPWASSGARIRASAGPCRSSQRRYSAGLRRHAARTRRAGTASTWPSIPRSSWGRDQRHHLSRGCPPGAVHRFRFDLHRLSGLHADTHAWTFAPQPVRSPSRIAATTEEFSKGQAGPPSRLSTPAACRPRCSTTSTSRRTPRRA